MAIILSQSHCIKSKWVPPQWPLRNSNEGIFCLHSSKTLIHYATWRDWSGSTLAQVMAYYLMDGSYYLNQYWLTISPVTFIQRQFQERYTSLSKISFKIVCSHFESNPQEQTGSRNILVLSSVSGWILQGFANICIRETGHIGWRYCFIACLLPSHCLKQWLFSFGQLQWKLDQKTNISQEIVFKSVARRLSIISASIDLFNTLQ